MIHWTHWITLPHKKGYAKKKWEFVTKLAQLQDQKDTCIGHGRDTTADHEYWHINFAFLEASLKECVVLPT